MGLYSAIKGGEIIPFSMTWMDLEVVIQSEVRDVPGGPVVKALRFHCRGHGFDLWSGN